MATTITTTSFPCALATWQNGKEVHGRQQQQQKMSGGLRGRNRRERTVVLTNCAVWRANMNWAIFATCKLEFGARLGTSRCGGGADFLWVPPSQSRLKRVAARNRLDDEFRERAEVAGDLDGEVSSLEGEDIRKEIQIDLQLPRRRLQVEFTCNVCQKRSQRLINPEAYKRGTVYVQCGGCETYHQLVDNLGLVVEYDFRNEADSSPDPLGHSD